MNEFYLHVKAPFAAYRYFQAGNYRVTMPTMPNSAAYGLVLNLAGIEMRTALDQKTTVIKPSAEDFRSGQGRLHFRLAISVGEVTPASKDTIYQQLHTYPVGDSSSAPGRGYF